MGIVKCRERARKRVRWPGLSNQLQELVKNCKECCKAQEQVVEPLHPSPLPDLPFQKVGTDLFEWDKKIYIPELLMCRKLQTTLPITCSCLNHIYIVPEKTKVRERDKSRKLRQENKYNVHHRATPLPQLCRGSHVWVPDHNSEAEVVEETNSRPYRVETPDGSYRRNRTALRPLPVQYENNETSNWN